MSRTSASNRLAWADRWSQPSLPLVLDPLKSQQRKIVNALLDQLGQLDRVERSIIWYGASLEVDHSLRGWLPPPLRATSSRFQGDMGIEPSTLCYLVPKDRAALYLRPPERRRDPRTLPMTLLHSKFIRDGTQDGQVCGGHPLGVLDADFSKAKSPRSWSWSSGGTRPPPLRPRQNPFPPANCQLILIHRACRFSGKLLNVSRAKISVDSLLSAPIIKMPLEADAARREKPVTPATRVPAADR